MLLAIGMSGFLVNPAGSKPAVGELVDEDLERHAVLQPDRDRRPQDVHQAADRRALLRHGDEKLAGPAVGIEPDVDIAFMALDVELVGQAAAGMRQPLAAGLIGRRGRSARRKSTASPRLVPLATFTAWAGAKRLVAASAVQRLGCRPRRLTRPSCSRADSPWNRRDRSPGP